MNFINNINFILTCGGSILRVFQHLADIINPRIRSRINFQQIHKPSTVYLHTTFTLPTRFTLLCRITIQTFCQNPRNRRFTHSARTRKQISMMQTPFIQGITQCFYHMLLPHQISKRFRTPLAGENLISHPLNTIINTNYKPPAPTPFAISRTAVTYIRL